MMEENNPPNTESAQPKSLPSGGNIFTYWLGSTLLKLCGWKVTGSLPNVPKLIIAVAPHTSNWDFFLGVLVLFYLKIKIRFFGKHTIFKPGLKQLLHLIGGMPIDRRSKHGVVEQITNAFNTQQQMILAVAPEGTRSPIFPWKTGFIAIARKAEVPVVLIGFDFALKQVIIGPSICASDNIDADMARVYAFFGTVTAKYPDDCLLESQD